MINLYEVHWCSNTKMKKTDVPKGQAIINYKYEYQIQIIYEYENEVPMTSG